MSKSGKMLPVVLVGGPEDGNELEIQAGLIRVRIPVSARAWEMYGSEEALAPRVLVYEVALEDGIPARTPSGRFKFELVREEEG